MDGWIKLYRKFIEWEWFKIPYMVQLFIYLLLSANHENKKWQGIDINRGQLLTGLNSLNQNTGISIQSLRTCLNRLKSTNEITIKSTNKYSLITICNYESYQGAINNINNPNNNQINKQLTNNQQTTNKQLTTNKNEEKDNNEKKVINNKSDKPTDFIDQIIDIFVQEYGEYEIINKGKERAAAGKLLKIYKKRYPDAASIDVLQGLRIYFNKCINIEDSWLRDNMSLPIIVNKFNEINKILKYGKSTGNNQKGATPEQLADLISRTEAIDRD